MKPNRPLGVGSGAGGGSCLGVAGGWWFLTGLNPDVVGKGQLKSSALAEAATGSPGKAEG